MGYESIYEKDLILEIKEGVLISETIVDNRSKSEKHQIEEDLLLESGSGSRKNLSRDELMFELNEKIHSLMEKTGQSRLQVLTNLKAMSQERLKKYRKDKGK